MATKNEAVDQPVAVADKTKSLISLGGFAIPAERRVQGAELTLNDRCDYCGAAAGARFTKPGTNHQLYFCGSHGRLHASGLINDGWSIDDQTWRMFTKG